MKRIAMLIAVLLGFISSPCWAQRPLESLDRGLVAIRQDDGKVWLSWRMFASDPPDIAFHVYRKTGPQKKRLTKEPIADVTWFIDSEPKDDRGDEYSVLAVVAGKEHTDASERTPRWIKTQRNYLTLKLDTPAAYTPNDGSVADLLGNGEFGLILHQASRGRDNSQAGETGEPILQAYTLAGKQLWSINLGRNIREGAHYTQFMVYDFDGDGRAEVACKTADGSVDGAGKVIGDASADHRNRQGYVLSGPEYLTIFDGKTGQALATTDYLPPRGRVADWGDDYGNRVDRFLAGVAYLDGKRPSLITCRGYYTRAVIVAWNWRDGKLTRQWTFDTDEGTEAERRAKRDYRGQGNHSLSIADVDGDGRDEIIYGACVIDDDGKGLYSTKLGHGDALHVTDHDPTRPGLEIFSIHEKVKHEHGVSFLDAKTGEILWSKSSPDVARGLAIDIDQRHPGSESWASGAGLRGLWNTKGELISDRKPRSCNFGVWWDGDLQRELLDRTTISKWNYETETETTLLRAEGCASNNGSKATPVLCADILGDWREEVIWRSADNTELRIYTTTIPTKHRRPTLMHDSQYRLAVAWQNAGYNQPPHLSYSLADNPELTTSFKQITHGPQHHFFGYFGHVRTIPWNASGNTMLALESEFQDRMPKPGEAANIVLLDVKDNYKPRVVDQTRAWNFQQGTMLYWNPLAAETQFFFNDRDPRTHEVFCVLFDTSKGTNGERIAEYRYEDSPIGNSGVAQNGGSFLAINYGRLARLRPVTGYPGVKDWTLGKERNPADDGIFKVNVTSKAKQLLVSYRQLADALREKHPNVDQQELFINHTLWSRDDSRIFFFARADFDNREKRIDVPFTMKPDGSDLKPLAMHISGHPEWASGTVLIGAKGNEQILFDVEKQEITGTLGTAGTFPSPGGDIALSPGGKLFINGHGSKGQNYYTILRRADGYVIHTPGFNQGGYVSGELRIDPSPNWNRDASHVMVVAVDEQGTRQMFVVELKPK